MIQFQPQVLAQAHAPETEDFRMRQQARFGRDGSFSKTLFVWPKPMRGEDASGVEAGDSAFQALLRDKSGSKNFLFFFVTPDSIPLFRQVRDDATHAGFGVGWSPLAPGEPAPMGIVSQGGEVPTIQ